MSRIHDESVTLDAEELATLLHKSPASVRSDLSRSPHLLPPRLRTGGKKPLWLRSSVLVWLESRVEICSPQKQSPTSPIKRKQGRPTKAEQIARLHTDLRIGGVQ